MMGSDALRNRYGRFVGKRFGSLVLLRISPARGERRRVLGEFQCDCGVIATKPVGRVISGYAPHHCGCQTRHDGHAKHGMRYTPEYSSWQSMKGRCLDSGNKDYPRWGGSGVTVFDEWIASFDAFYRHIGPRPAGFSLDRIDNTKGYEPGNVRWASPQQQASNRRNSYRWVVHGREFESASDAARYYGVSDMTIHRWVKGYFDPRRGTRTPPKKGCFFGPRYENSEAA